MKERLKQYQDQENLTDADLAKRLGLSRSFVWRYLRGHKNMSIKTASKVARITGVPVLDLLRVNARSAR